MLGIIIEQGKAAGCTRIKKIHLEIGQLAGIDKEALLFSFSVAAKETIAEHALLEITDVAGQAICDFCHETVMLKNYYDACQNCGRFLTKIICGEALRVKSMEVE